MNQNSTTLPTSLAKQSTFQMWLSRENKLFSYFLEESISNANVLRVCHALTAFTFVGTTLFTSLVAMLVCLAWFIMTLYLCKKGGLK